MAINKMLRICTTSFVAVFHLSVSVDSSAYTLEVTTAEPGADPVVEIGSWYHLSDSTGWTFRPQGEIEHVELALYDSTAGLAVGSTPFELNQVRASGSWPDGPENELGEFGYEVSPHVLGDNNQHLFGKPHYQSIRLYGGTLSPAFVYRVSFVDSIPHHLWLHPLRAHHFTMSTDILQSSEGTLINPVYGPASVTRTILNADSTRFAYTGLSPDVATGLKDDYPVGDYDQRPASHGNGDFGWFPGYSLAFQNEGPGSVIVALFLTTGFTGPSGAPSNTLANDTFWKSDAVSLAPGDTATVELDLDSVQGYSLEDNPFPHTAGDQAAPDGTSGAAVNVFDRLQVSAIGWEVASGGSDPADASLVITPNTTSIDPVTSVEFTVDSLVPALGLLRVTPNPFVASTRVEYTAPQTGPVAIRIYDVRGHLTKTLEERSVPAGPHSVFWNGRNESGLPVASGIYFVRLISFDQELVRKVLVFRQ